MFCFFLAQPFRTFLLLPVGERSIVGCNGVQHGNIGDAKQLGSKMQWVLQDVLSEDIVSKYVFDKLVANVKKLRYYKWVFKL